MGYVGVPLLSKYTKKEQGELVLSNLSRGLNGKILDHKIVDSVLYAAIRHPEMGVFAAIVPFEQVKRDGYWELLYDPVDEMQGPNEVRCPMRILNMLDETTDKYATNWRKKCRARIAETKHTSK